MKKALFYAIATMTISLNTFAGTVCPAPRTNVIVKIDSVFPGDVGPSFCYATEIGKTNRFEILDCGYLNKGDIVTGTVFTYWTKKDSTGIPVCDYQSFVPKF